MTDLVAASCLFDQIILFILANRLIQANGFANRSKTFNGLNHLQRQRQPKEQANQNKCPGSNQYNSSQNDLCRKCCRGRSTDDNIPLDARDLSMRIKSFLTTGRGKNPCVFFLM